MKYLVQTAYAAALIGLSSHVYAAVNGINYDPAHDQQWIEAQGGKPPPNNRPSNPAEMERLFKRDLDQIVGMGFKIIKTYYAKFTGYDGKPLPDAIAKIAQQKGIQVMLGVFEFRPGNARIGEPADGCNGGGVDDPGSCRNWTRQQADAAISQANSYGDTVIGIVVGNEDMFNQPGAECCVADPLIQGRVAEDIDYIKGKVSIPVTTAQRQPDWVGRDNSINKTNPNGILGKLAVAGVNIFPYWGPNFVNEKTGCNGRSEAFCTQPTAQTVLSALMAVSGSTVKSVIVTEEGWPSCYSKGNQHPTDVTLEADYLTNWLLHENQMFDSYYFMAYDLRSVCDLDTGGDANRFFGLCTANGSPKDGLPKTCPAALQRQSPAGD